MTAMKIGILGTGDVGQALGRGFVSLGHEVKMGSRDVGNEKSRAWATKTGERASTGTFADAAAFADLAVLATPAVALGHTDSGGEQVLRWLPESRVV